MIESLIADRARLTPDKIAVFHHEASYTYTQFATWIEAARRYLAAQELPKDGVAVIAEWNILESWVLLFALRGIGLTTVVVGGNSSLDALGLDAIGAVVTISSEPGAVTNERDGSQIRFIRLPAELRNAPEAGSLPENINSGVRPGGHIMVTSGTTGTSKKILRAAGTEAGALPLHADINEIDSESIVYVMNFPVWTAGGYRWPLITWSAGGTVVIHQKTNLHYPLTKYAVTHVFATPRLVDTLIQAAGESSFRNDNARLLVTGGAMSRATFEAARTRVTNRVYSVLASTEALTLGVTPLTQPEDLLWHRIHPAREVQIVDASDQPVPSGTVGAVRVRIIDGLSGYMSDEAATRTFFRDGFFYPGDLGMLDENGRLQILGRSSDVINIKGDKLATGPAERFLADRLHADGVCILSVPDEQGNEIVCVVIESKTEIASDAIRAAVVEALKGFPSMQVRLISIESMPRNEMGKIQRLKLKQSLAKFKLPGGGVLTTG